MILRETHNTSLLFLLPLISRKNEKWVDYTGAINLFTSRDDSLVNGYNIDANKPWLDKHVFLLFEASIYAKLNSYNIESNKNFSVKYATKIDNIFYNVYAYQIPDELEETYNLIMEGEYTSIPSKIKSDIMDFWQQDTKSLLFKSLYQNKKILGKIEAEEIPEQDFVRTREEVMEEIMEQNANKKATTV